MSEGKKTAYEYMEEATKELAPYKLRASQEERDYAAQWMASARQFQDMLNEALDALADANADTVRLNVRVQELQQELARRDRSFRPPPTEVV